MYLQKGISIQIFLLRLEGVTNRARSGSSPGSVCHKYGSEDTDPYQNVTEPEQWKNKKKVNAHFEGHVVTAGGQEFALRVPLDGVHLVGVSLQERK
jgi:hypothetical protein